MRSGIGPWAGSPAKEAGRGRAGPRLLSRLPSALSKAGRKSCEDCYYGGSHLGLLRPGLRRPAVVRKPALWRRWACVRPPTSFVLRKLSSSPGEAIAIVGTTGDGAVAAGIDVVLAQGAAWAGVVRRDGTDGDGQATARSRGLRDLVGQESSARDHSRNRSLAGADGIFVCFSPAATWPHASRSPPCP
ncbi:hypothetical protein SAMN05216337_10839 [Bradyrhizobium brasilense]|uniref:Uncharacterized protein n=1 Tax=Bradyrhizobium brasilense TaxID=1419277 RepID=A0A1G7PQX1_9BRAD|nr:hypothetical protein SAMN05216337_10839 [Bradyrhizobium brasilense]